MRKSTLAAGISALALAATLTTPAQAHRPRDPEVVADGLVGALTLAATDRGDVLVTQSFTGVLSKVDHRGRVRDVYSLENPEAGELIGVATDDGATYHIESDFSGEAATSLVIRTSKRGHRTEVGGDLWAYETQKNPGAAQHYGFQGLDAQCAAEVGEVEAAIGFPLNDYPGIVESHAYPLDVHRRRVYVADAAANAVLKINERSGRISTVAVLPAVDVTVTAELLTTLEERLLGGTQLPDCVVGHEFASEPVPTDVRVARDGSLYVSTLGGGIGEVVPQSHVYRIDSRGRVREVAEGLHGATGLALTRSGDVVVAQMFAGEVSLIREHRRHTHVDTLFTTDKPPADVDVSGRTLYVTTADVFGDATGALLKYRLHH